jgi:hypothetical protein
MKFGINHAYLIIIVLLMGASSIITRNNVKRGNEIDTLNKTILDNDSIVKYTKELNAKLDSTLITYQDSIVNLHHANDSISEISHIDNTNTYEEISNIDNISIDSNLIIWSSYVQD